MNSYIFQLIQCQITPTLCASNQTVGDGVIAVIVFIFVGIFICAIGRCFGGPLPIIFGVVGTILPLLVQLIIYVWPKDSEKGNDSVKNSDHYTALRIVWYIFIILGGILSILIYILLKFMTVNKAHVIDTGFTMLEDIFRRKRKEIIKEKKLKDNQIFIGKEQAKPDIKRRDYSKKNMNSYFETVIEDRRKFEEQEAKDTNLNPYNNFPLEQNYTDKRPNVNLRGADRGRFDPAQNLLQKKPRNQQRLTPMGQVDYKGYDQRIDQSKLDQGRPEGGLGLSTMDPPKKIEHNVQMDFEARRKIDLGLDGDLYTIGTGEYRNETQQLERMALEKSRYTGFNAQPENTNDLRSSYMNTNNEIRKSTNFEQNNTQQRPDYNNYQESNACYGNKNDTKKGLHNISDAYNFDDDVVINDVEMGKSLHESVYADDNQFGADFNRNQRYGN